MMLRTLRRWIGAPDAAPCACWRPTRLLTLTTLMLLLVLFAVWTTVWTLLQEQRRQAVEAEYRQNANISRALQEQTARVISAVDQAVLRLATLAAKGPVPAEEHQRIVDATGLSEAILPQLSLVDHRGHFAGSNVDPGAAKAGPVDLSDREHVKVHLQPGAASAPAPAMLTSGGLYVGPPVLGKVSNKWTIQLSRAVRDAGGAVRGVVVGSIDARYFEEVYRQVALGQQGGVSLVGDDGILRARVIGGQGGSGIGTSLGSSSRLVRQQLGRSGQWSFPSRIDGIERIAAYHRVGEYPLYVFAISGMTEALAPWRATRNLVVGLASLLSLLLCVTGWMLVRGVSQLESQHRELQLREAQAQSASEAKTQFLAAISHELRTPLTSIVGFAELLERRTGDDFVQGSARFIRQGAERLNALLTEIIDLSQVDTGSMEFSAARHDLRTLVDEAASPFQVRAREKGLALDIVYADGLPATIWTDATRFRQILGNLLSNAVKFTRRGHVTLSVSAQPDGWALTVSDTGPGIAPEQREQVFENFRQADGRVSYEHGGTGLGLALARGIARRMGGDVYLLAEPVAGCHVVLALPLGEG
ncbi:cache domain-containing sensor histidine kinase [Paracidovorax wautersii]|uniref:histidine kinase n=1 Tax=Paracidovorax wautersii TaxID=1177982 RepID=A0A1I2GAL4_9BURK|nr:ATP-binding protein [Paracidovorax wautersii]SFF14228.1 Signal transduction histidine kinase [Paracidovorax wautersii]